MKYTTTHTAYFNSDKIEVPSVTTILKILNKPALVKWANYLGFKRQNVNDILERSAMIGTTVHDLISAYLTNKYVIWIGTHRCSKKLISCYLNSFLEWKRTHNITPIFSEKQFVSESFGGTIDLYAEVDGKSTLIDFKTSKKPYSSMFLQLAAYCIMLEAEGYKIDQVAIVIINENGYNEKFMSREMLEPYIDTFKNLVKVFHKWYDLNVKHGWGDILG